MALSYRVWTEEEDSKRGLLDNGEYSFKVTAIQQKPTSKGTYEMLEVDLSVISMEGRTVRLRDWIVLMDDMGWKLRHFAATCGLLDKYEAQTLRPGDFLNRDGVVKVKQGEAKDKNGNKTGELRNHVVDYVKPLDMRTPKMNDDTPPFIDDDIPNM